MTMAFGDHNEMEACKKMLSEMKESIINAYQLKTGLEREEISEMMEDETLMSAYRAIEKGFADGLIAETEKRKDGVTDFSFSGRVVASNLYDKLKTKFAETEIKKEEPVDDGSISVDGLYARLNSLRS